MRGIGVRLSKNDSSSSRSTARSIPGLTASTCAGSLSLDWLLSTKSWLAYVTTWALVRIRLPSMTTPVPLASLGLCLVQGLVRSGNRIVAVIFTTESRIFASAASSSAAAAVAGLR